MEPVEGRPIPGLRRTLPTTPEGERRVSDTKMPVAEAPPTRQGAAQLKASSPGSTAHAAKPSNDSRPVHGRPLIELEGIGLKLGGRDILEGIDFAIHEHEIVTLIGPNGGGKTSMVRVMLGLERPTAGRVIRRPRLKIGYVPQFFDRDLAMPLRTGDFLALGIDVSEQERRAALTECGAEAVYASQLGRLSGGELQRVLIARAILRRPDLLVLDEPVRGVDHFGEADLYNLIGRLRAERGFGVVLVSHDLHVVMAASDRVICLNRHICCSGQPVTVTQHPEYARLFGREAAKAVAVYEHHHDHAHDISGEPLGEDGGSHSGCSHGHSHVHDTHLQNTHGQRHGHDAGSETKSN